MQTAMPIFHEDAARDVTLAAHTQAVERAIQAMHTHLHEVLTLFESKSEQPLEKNKREEVFSVAFRYTESNA